MADRVMTRFASFNHAFMRGIQPQVNFNIIQNIQLQVLNMATESNPVHALIAFVFLGLVAFIQIRYPENPTPFQLHPKTTMVSIASFLLYCLAFLGRLNFAIRVHHFDTLMHVFGSLSLISLVFLLLPHTWESFGFIVYMLWFITHVLFVIRTRLREIWVQVQRWVLEERRPLPITSRDLT